jgi:hypothetical protein
MGQQTRSCSRMQDSRKTKSKTKAPWAPSPSPHCQPLQCDVIYCILHIALCTISFLVIMLLAMRHYALLLLLSLLLLLLLLYWDWGTAARYRPQGTGCGVLAANRQLPAEPAAGPKSQESQEGRARGGDTGHRSLSSPPGPHWSQ